MLHSADERAQERRTLARRAELARVASRLRDACLAGHGLPAAVSIAAAAAGPETRQDTEALARAVREVGVGRAFAAWGERAPDPIFGVFARMVGEADRQGSDALSSLLTRLATQTAKEVSAARETAAHQGGHRTTTLAEDLSALGAPVRPTGWHGLVEKVGDATARLWARMGRASDDLQADLAVRGKTSGTFYGERVAGGVLLLLWVPVMRILGVHIPLAPVWSLVLGAVGFFLPARLVKAKAAAGRQELSDGVAEVAVLMSLAVSAGSGIDAAFRAAVS